MATDPDEFIPINQILNSKPKLGPIPGDQVIAWVVIVVVSYTVCQGFLGLGWIATVLVAVWGMSTWWVLTGNAGWRFLSKFQGVPRWTLGHALYQSLVDVHRKVASTQKPPVKKHRKRRRRK